MSSCSTSMARALPPSTETRFTVDDTVARLRREVVEPIKKRFVGRDEIVDLMVLAATAGEHLFLHGPPGTAKSALIRQFALAVRASYFEYLLTRFSEPNEVFGPIDLVRLREGTVATVTTRMLPEGEFVFLDELFNANSAILNNLLTVLNERLYRRGAEVHQLPLLSLFAASNHLPEDEALRALVRPVPACAVMSTTSSARRCHACSLAGWDLEQSGPIESSVSANDLRHLARQIYQVELSGDRRALCRRRLQGSRSGRGFLRPPGRQGAQAGGGLGRPLRPLRGPRFRLLGVPLRLGPRGASRPADRARGRRDRAPRRGARYAPTGRGPQPRRRRRDRPPARRASPPVSKTGH